MSDVITVEATTDSFLGYGQLPGGGSAPSCLLYLRSPASAARITKDAITRPINVERDSSSYLRVAASANTVAHNRSGAEIGRILFFPPQPSAGARAQLTLLQKWEGTVVEVSSETFIATLSDLTQANPEEEAEFLISDVSQDDLDFVKVGAGFYWNIGYLDTLQGQRTRVSYVRFRRLPPVWAATQMTVADQEASELAELFET